MVEHDLYIYLCNQTFFVYFPSGFGLPFISAKEDGQSEQVEFNISETQTKISQCKTAPGTKVTFRTWKVFLVQSHDQDAFQVEKFFFRINQYSSSLKS